MLTELNIRDFAVIESLDIDFSKGMTVFTGETGAGKSIIVDAMSLILGARSDSSVVRAGQDRTEITARFVVSESSDIKSLLKQQEIDIEDELYIRRVINIDGRSKAFVNGTPTPIQFLKTLSEHLVDIHGQHEHQSLLRKDSQCGLLDDFAKHPGLIKKVNDHYQLWVEIQRQLKQLSGEDDNREAQLNLLKYQVEELQALNIQPGEYNELNEEFKRLNNASTLLQTVQNSIDAITDSDQSILSALHHHHQAITNLVNDDESLKPIIELLENAIIQLEEAIQESRNYLDHVEINPEKLIEVENRIGSLHETARKHHIQPQQLEEHFNKLKNQLDTLEGGEARYKELVKLETKAREAYTKASEELHQSRVREAKKLDQAIILKLQQLGMAGGRFETTIDYEKSSLPQKNGLDKIEFLVSANPGQPLKPIAKVASGGELSRISLAIQVVNREDNRVPTFVFDEVDAGIGGSTADIVGQLLHSLTANNQVFCVTHLPQVACYGDNHFHVKKFSTDESTQTQVRKLDDKSRVTEIARMLGGKDITEKSLAHAMEMLDKKRETAA